MSKRVPKVAAQSADDQLDLLVSEVIHWPIKDDLASMEFALFSLAKQKDTRTRVYRNGARTMRIIPSSVGAATMFDKDLMLFAGSQIVEARNRGLPVARTLRIDSYGFLMATKRGDGGASYDRIIDMLRRLRGTTIETNIPTGEERVVQTRGFAMLESYEVLSSHKRRKDGQQVERVMSFTITISEWLYNALLNYEVLTLDPRYFEIRRPFDRRLYEIARKFCGDQAMWKCSLPLLAEKLGTDQEMRNVREKIREVIRDDSQPQFRLALDVGKRPHDVVFYTRDGAKLAQALIKNDSATWFSALERYDNQTVWAERSKDSNASD